MASNNHRHIARHITLTSLVLAGFSAVAHEHTTPEFMQMRQVQFIDRYDADTDGRVSSVEFEQARRDRFDITDEDGNGWVSQEEYVYEWEDRLDTQMAKDRAGQVKQTVVRFGALDRDDDEQMSWAEYQGSGERMFSRRDTNADGVLNEDDPEPERRRQREQAGTEAEREAQQRQRLLARANRMLRMPSTHNLEGLMTRYDTNEDANITRAEFDAIRKIDFERTDDDGSGWVSEDEYVAEYEDRLDTQIAASRAESVKQAGRRFEALDTDENAQMTFAEYQVSGHRMFSRWDTGADGYVSFADTIPEFQELVAQSDDSPQERDPQDTPSDSSSGGL
ncbi:MAG: hypothetical protein AAF529_23195 [Pseudomonadota bacterium]